MSAEVSQPLESDSLRSAAPGAQTAGAKDARPHIALCIGDPAGVGPEIIVSLLADAALGERARVTLIGNGPALEAAAASRKLPVPVSNDWLTVIDWRGYDRHFTPATVGADNGAFILESLQLGTRLVTEGDADALCFGPLNKGAMRKGGMQEEDEMRWFARILNYGGTCGEFNVLDKLWTARVTSHVPLASVSSLLTAEKVAGAIQMLHGALVASGNQAPRIGVCGLNPHNGDNGNYGSEEGDIIAPGIELAAERGVTAEGPFPADTIFLRARAGQLDGIVTMYHDQGQIATKLLGFDIGVTVQGGLPIPVTTPAHGTAYDIVGKGIAQTTAMVNAFDLACRMGLGSRAQRGR
ncbi:4-hydroxythreonine-4-phosphate dehydrogenase PdxA [Chitinasiproducens palmae]|uniref:4-hydroxythreonine-4-phosphate dehydrogenase n=1 Tax=Chitinasiproducens palmae TaxID=1770053 RepID=A0A1H2PJN6_9BURK|nr:4-hydroxythreonine-4-phosphate dehydrogenase PdxA [Chitinasiproducens palmae]SDV46562.1 4-hydroxythreonine-4-phosphate dehydrogenase [Chitinasiproducens palmae]